MIAQSVLDAISDGALRQAARQTLTDGAYTSTLTLRAKTKARTDLIDALPSIAASDGRAVAADLMQALYPHLSATFIEAELTRIVHTPQYFRSRNNTIHTTECPHRPATVWRYAAGKSQAAVTELLVRYPWLHWCQCDYCRPREVVGG